MLIQQCAEDIESFQNKKQILKRTNIVLILALQQTTVLHELYQQFQEQSNSLRFSKRLKSAIEYECPGVLEEVKSICDRYRETCSQNISSFQHQDTVAAINGILRAISENLYS